MALAEAPAADTPEARLAALSELQPKTTLRGGGVALDHADVPAQYQAQTANGRFRYYKKAPHSTQAGFVRWGSANASDTQSFIRRGMQPLAAYGEFSDINKDEPPTPGGPSGRWDIRRDPYRRLLRLGGAHEFPVPQILEQGWHRTPPPGFTLADFPQLQGVDLAQYEHKCPYCPRILLSEEGLHAHEAARHKDTSQTNALSRGIAKASAATTESTVQALLQRMEQLDERAAAREERMVRLVAHLMGQDAPDTPAPAAVEPKPKK